MEAFFFFFSDENFLIYSSEKTVKEDILHLDQIGLTMALGRVTSFNTKECAFMQIPCLSK